VASIGRYQVLQEIGRGAMGIVYEARDPVLDRTVALKVIQPAEQGGEPSASEDRFFAEAKIAAQLQHPGIVVVHDVGRDTATGALFIALELLRGETLADLAERGPLDWRTALQLVAQVAHALHYAHGQGVVHRDIKPANVIVLPSGEAKVTDFGIARLESARQRLTSAGEFIGTPLYTAPEQARNEEVDRRADVFSLASVAYTLLTGRPPFQAASIPGIVHRVVYEEPEPPSHLVPDLPPDVDRVLARAMAKDPAARYPTAEAFAQDAEDVLAGRHPHHTGGEELVVVDEPDASGTVRVTPSWRRPEAATPPPAHPTAADDTRTVPPAVRPPSTRARVLAGVAVVLGLVALFLWAPKPPPDQPRPSPGPTLATPAATPTAPAAEPVPDAASPAPASSAKSAEPARLRIDFEHPLRRGRLRIFVDDRLTLEQRLHGQERKKALVFTVHEGVFRDELDVKPGLHEVRVEVAWEDNVKVERIVGNFSAGTTRRLEASLGRIRRDLSLEWK